MSKEKTKSKTKFTTTGWPEKHRPRKLRELVGQDHIVQQLKTDIKTRELPPSYMLHGGYGQGKTTTAHLLGRYLNCATNDACGKCDSCKHPMDSHPDVIEVNASETRGIDDVRNLIQRSNFMPTYNIRVVIIDEIQGLTSQAQGALLKILERPPASTLFVLCTTDPHKIIPTIVSRGRQLAVKPVKDEVMAARLAEICKIENVKVKEKVLLGCARMSGGHARNAVHLLHSAVQYIRANPNADTEKIMSQIETSSSPGDENVAVKMLLCLYKKKPTAFAKTAFDAESAYNVLGRMMYGNEAMLALATDSRPNGMWISKSIISLYKDLKPAIEEILEIQQRLATAREKAADFAVPERNYLYKLWSKK